MENKELIFYGGLLVCIVYLTINTLLQITKSKQRNASIEKAQREYDIALNEQTLTKRKLFDSISNVYGQEKADRVNDGTIWVGMPMYLLMVAVGRAKDIKESITKGKKIEKWYYGEYQTRVGTYKYKLEVTLENDVVAGWKDLV